jgi:hypothetical protein
VTPEIAASLAARDIRMVAQAKDYCMFVRGDCLALVQTAGDRFTSIGSSAILTETGLAYLVWVDGKAMLASHGTQVEAAVDQVAAIRKFSQDLKNTIWPQMSADEHR